MKRLLLTIILIISLLGLCSCGNNLDKEVAQETETETTATPAQETVTKPATQESTSTASGIEAEPETSSKEVSILHLTQTTINIGKYAGNADDYKGRSYVYYPAFSLLEEDAIQYPKLQSALDKINSHYESEYLEHLNYSDSLAKEAIADGTDMQIDFFDCQTPEIRRADTHIVSILENYDMYAGGPHGYNSFYGDNFDPETGNEIYLSDVVTDMDSFRETVKEKLYAQYPNVEFDDLDTALKDMDTDSNSVMPWSMDYSGVTLYFNPYHLSSYAAGMQVITVPFNEKPKLFKDVYLDIPEAYTQQLNNRTPAVLDINGDGINETLFVMEEDAEEPSEDGYTSGYKNFVISCGDKEVTISDYCYRATNYLVRANGQYYVYIFEISDNDFSLCTVVDLKTMKNDKSKTFNAHIAGLGSDYKYNDAGYKSVSSEYIFTDPNAIPLSSRIEILGSNSGTKLYRISQDGWPVSDETYFEIMSAMVLTAKQDVSCKEVDNNGSVKSDAIITAGKYYILVRTDNETWADIQELKQGEFTEQADYPYVFIEDVEGIRSDRPIYRLQYKSDTWPRTINGIDEAELFDGILYAG